MRKVILATTLLLSFMSFTPTKKIPLYTPLHSTIQNFEQQFDQISEERKAELLLLTDYITNKVKSNEPVQLIFICTHNSRRSHISQIWAQTAAAFYDIPQVKCYSGGTESTAFNPRAVHAMESAGFKIAKLTEDDNPIYEVSYAKDMDPIEAFSKRYDYVENPNRNFAAIMTCSHADRNCPLVAGAEDRISIPYEDPKVFDGTPQEAAMYAERVQQIGNEMIFVFSQVAGNLHN